MKRTTNAGLRGREIVTTLAGELWLNGAEKVEMYEVQSALDLSPQKPSETAVTNRSLLKRVFLHIRKKSELEQIKADRLLEDFEGWTELFKEIKIQDNYMLRAYKIGDQWGSVVKVYCCRKDAEDVYVPMNDKGNHVPYRDSCRIHGILSWNEDQDVPTALNFFTVPFTEEGIMEAWILDNISNFLPLFWHCCDTARHYIFTEEDWAELFTPKLESEDEDCRRVKVCGKQMLAINAHKLLPNITINSDTAILCLAYWSDWEGLVSNKILVRRHGDSVTFEVLHEDCLFSYDCGVIF